MRENDPYRLPASQFDQHRYHLSRRRHSGDLVAKPDGRLTFRAVAEERLRGFPNHPGLLRIVGQCAAGTGRCQHLRIDELISSLGEQQLREPNLERAHNGPGTSVMHDEIDQGQHRRLRHEPFDMHVVGQFAERGWLTLGTNGDQDVDVQRCYLTDRAAEHLDRAERDGAQGEVHPGRVRAALSQPGTSALDSL